MKNEYRQLGRNFENCNLNLGRVTTQEQTASTKRGGRVFAELKIQKKYFAEFNRMPLQSTTFTIQNDALFSVTISDI